MIEGYYLAMSSLFAPLLAQSFMLTELVVALIVTFIITLTYKLLVDQNKMREIKGKQKTLQDEVKALQKASKTEEANKKMNEMLQLSNQMMKQTFKPMPITMLVALMILPWMSHVITGAVVNLPFNLPYFGADFGWLMWYFVLTIPMTQFFRKIMGVE